jgi:glycerol-3-phosphate acyltransferase PlsY
MGLGTASGSLLAVSPLSLAVFLGLLIALLLTLHHAARAAALSGLLIAPLLWLLGLRDAFLLAGLIGVVIAFRFFSDWDRQYKELWLDRE